MKHYAVIPARYASTRFPGKPLALLNGKPMLQHVYENVNATKLFDEVFIATDDLRIAAAGESFGATVVMTDSSLPSGTDRVAALTEMMEPDCVIINVQGDEPLISKTPLAALLKAFEDNDVRIASLMTPLDTPEDLNNPNIVKVVTDTRSNALYFSRSTIPFDRDGKGKVNYFRHIGVYAFRYEALHEFVALSPGILENTEKLEQLRALEHGLPIRMVITDYQGIGIDSPNDLRRVEQFLKDI
ncbi:MAG TPA: 3-deoxy-manno-octulosonate cytidylyltransferase [Candidatus Cloacimonadota bacterium]|nr:3-deoxy-manno-octulosonate cytidylyltransferase [Candidatus Cloacimonadota bacterium]